MVTSSKELEKLILLKQKIELAKDLNKPEIAQPESHQSISYAWRMVLELVIGMAIGVIIGYTLDYLLKTAPWMLITMSLFGFGAGIRAMMKTAEELTRSKTK